MVLLITQLPKNVASSLPEDQLRLLTCCSNIICHSAEDLPSLLPLMWDHQIWVHWHPSTAEFNDPNFMQDADLVFFVEQIASILDQGAHGVILNLKKFHDLANLKSALTDRGIGLNRVRVLNQSEPSLSQCFMPIERSSGSVWSFDVNQSASDWHQDWWVNAEQQVPVLNAELVLNGQINIGFLLAKSLKSDRSDGLIPTVVVNEQRVSLGLVYSSSESISESIRSGRGVYYSRSRQSLWYKGELSGAVQKLLGISVDCDADALQFTVVQQDPGFCHLMRSSCFGDFHGLEELTSTLKDRLDNPIPGSYTNKLFSNSNLLHSKILEEAQELCDASQRDDIIWEAADVLYFTLVKCVKNNVSLSDVCTHLAGRSRKVTRRPGLAKTQTVVPPSQDTLPEDRPDNSDLSLQVYDSSNMDEESRRSLLQRPIMKTDEIMSRVTPIINAVRKNGDKAVLEYTETFDRIHLDSPVLKPPFSKYWEGKVCLEVQNALDLAFSNIKTFHEAQVPTSSSRDGEVNDLEPGCLTVETMPGVVCSRFTRPIERVGLYVPGGSAILPSTTLMLGVPALVAGCKSIWIATPPNNEASVCPEVAYVAEKVGAAGILLAGGAQAVAALAYGTESVPSVDKICGPGNQYVTAAKMLVQNDPSCLVSIDMPAGPSEVLVIADETSNPSFVASDLLSQAEHGPDSQVVLLTSNMSHEKLQLIQNCIQEQALVLPRCSIVRESLKKSFVLKFKNLDDCLEFSNQYAPEHLILHVEHPRSCISRVQNAGSVFLGPYSPESCGDYASGTNHTLPTYGYARMYSGVNTNTFLKHITAQEITAEGLNNLGETVMTLAEIEGLEAHKNAVKIRLDEIRGC